MSQHSSQDGRRTDTLSLTINDWEAFTRSTEKLYSNTLELAAVECKTEASFENGGLVVTLHVTRPPNTSRWVRKIECCLRWPRLPQSAYAPRRVIFCERNVVARWSKIAPASQDESDDAGGNKVELLVDVTHVPCYVTDGAFGIRLRFHDVALDSQNFRFYSNKGILAANAEYFDEMFFRDADGKNKEVVSLNDVDTKDFCIFLLAIAPSPPPIISLNVLQLLRMAHRFKAHQLSARCIEFILTTNPANFSFVEQLKIADELDMRHFRDLLIDFASEQKLMEAATAENEDKFTRHTWMKLFRKYKQLKRNG